MAFIAYLRSCAYWLFLALTTGFLAISLLELSPSVQSVQWLHPFFLYAALVSMLLSICLSITLLVCKPAEDGTPASGTSIGLTLGSTLLVSGMIAALLFFL